MFLPEAYAFIAKARWRTVIVVSNAFVKNVEITVAMDIVLYATDS